MSNRKNLIYTAALLATDADAKELLSNALGLGTEIATVADVYLPEGREWKIATTEQRASAIGDWLRGEAFAVIERAGRLTTVADPLATVGTRD